MDDYAMRDWLIVSYLTDLFFYSFDVQAGWEYQELNCYKYFNIKHSWEKAAELCRRWVQMNPTKADEDETEGVMQSQMMITPRTSDDDIRWASLFCDVFNEPDMQRSKKKLLVRFFHFSFRYSESMPSRLFAACKDKQK